MKITLLTANQPRHNYLITILSRICKELYVIQESRSIFPGKSKRGLYKKTKTHSNYFKKVYQAEIKVFGKHAFSFNKQNVTILSIERNDMNLLKLSQVKEFLKSEIYINYGTSVIKGDLLKFLVNKKCINIHNGISPYYIGSDCNFWAVYDKNFSFVGSTVHYLTKKIDFGEVLFHSSCFYNGKSSFEFTMYSIKLALVNLRNLIKNKKIYTLKSKKINKKKLIRHSYIKNFNIVAIKKFNKIKFKKFNNKNFLKLNLINPFIIKAKKNNREG